MSYLNNNAQDYEQSLQRARVSLLNSTFDQFWIQPEISPLIESKTSSTKIQSPWSNLIKSQLSIILLILLTIILLLFSLPFIIRSQYHASRFLHQCSSLACISTSHRIIENLNFNINPCENFYLYACDGWMNTHFLSPSETSIGYFKEIYKKNLILLYEILKDNSNTNSKSTKKLKAFFNSCMNTTNTEKTARKTLLNILHKVGKSPLLSPDWSLHDFNLISSLLYAHQHGINPFFRISITIDEKNNNYHRISFEQSGLSFDEKSNYNNENIRYLFNHCYIKLLNYLHPSSSSHKLSKQIDGIFLFEKHLASIFPLKKSNNPLKFYHIRTYQQIQLYFSSWLNLENYLQKIFRKDKSFFFNQTFLIYTPEYFLQLNQIVQTTPKYILMNYITLQVVQELIPYMPESFSQIRRPLKARLKGITEEKQLWEICVKRTDDAFGFATGRKIKKEAFDRRKVYLGALFISKIFNEKSKEKIEHIVEEIRLAFVETLPKIQWMDFQTRQQAQMKAKMIIGI